ncbi:MAG: ACP S-malonyltransferase [Halobacteriovoraceae bacterium]|nr:ACP S-malonyltransferase [Halobacteriovoraceae bacterium]
MTLDKNNIIIAFPGQGSQFVGMGKNILDSHYQDIAKKYFELANQCLGFDLQKLCLEGPSEKLAQTSYTQPAIFTVSMIYFEIIQNFLKEFGLNPALTLGHSVGEYGALCAAGVLDFGDTVKATHIRGRAMQEATPLGFGTMMAILKVPSEIISQACELANKETGEVVVPANFNSPIQTVISGTVKGCKMAVKKIEELFDGRMRAVKLQVSAPFHSPLMEPAEQKLRQHFEAIQFHENKISYLANVDAQTYSAGTAGEKIKENLIAQVSRPVRWVESINALPGESFIIELGPGTVLNGLIRKINQSFSVFSVEEALNIEERIQALKEIFNK